VRTTLTLDPDVLEKARRAALLSGRTFKETVNEALRTGLDAMEKPQARRYRLKPRPLGLRKGLNYDNTAELLALAEEEAFR